MEHLGLEIFDLTGTGSKFAYLPDDTSITITVTSQVFDSGDVWSYSFTLNAEANAHIFGTSGELHGARLYEQINKRHARLWVEGLPMYYGHLILDGEVDVDEDGNIDVRFEGGHKSFEDMLKDMNAQDVSVGDVVIGIALNRKRGIYIQGERGGYQIDSSVVAVDPNYGPYLANTSREFESGTVGELGISILSQRWPKLVLSKGHVTQLPNYILNTGTEMDVDYTNIQVPFDNGHPFCNVNVCYQKKYTVASDNGGTEEKTARGYTMRLARGEDTTLGGDNQTRFNNAPNFYLLYWLKRLFIDKNIHVDENQMMDVEDLRRVFLANLGCFYEEMDTDLDSVDNYPMGGADWDKYGYYAVPKDFVKVGQKIYREDEERGSVLARNITFTREDTSQVVSSISSAPGLIYSLSEPAAHFAQEPRGYLAYATGKNYPDVDAQEVIDAVESAFGVRFLFNNDYSRVRIVLLRNLFRSDDIQELGDDVISATKSENGIRGFCMTYGGEEKDTNYNYNDWSRIVTDKDYETIKRNYVTAFNKRCYITMFNGDAYRIKVDEDEKVFFPVLMEVAGYCDAKDGDCSGEEDTVETVTVGATPLIMNEVDGGYAVFSNEEMLAPGDAEVNAQAPLQSIQVTERFYSAALQTYIRLDMDVDIYVKEGYIAKLEDNYDLSGDGDTPFDKADLGLCLGVMRSSGSNAYVKYESDAIGNEGNDWWEEVPGSGAIDHPDTCDREGNLWDYNGGTRIIGTPADAISAMQSMWPQSNFDLVNRSSEDYLIGITTKYGVKDTDGDTHVLLLARSTMEGTIHGSSQIRTYVAQHLAGKSVAEMYTEDASRWGILIEVDGSNERAETLKALQRLAFAGGYPVVIDGAGENGVGVRDGRFSLKLRAEKPNPAYDPTQPEGDGNRRYLEISNSDLRRRGLADQFYREYSYWVRNARMTSTRKFLDIAQLQTLDNTVRVHVGDVTGFIKKMQFSVSKQEGLSATDLDILYI